MYVGVHERATGFVLVAFLCIPQLDLYWSGLSYVYNYYCHH